MAEVSIPFADVAIKDWTQERFAPAQTSMLDAGGRRHVVDTGVRLRRGTFRLEARTDGDAKAHETVFEAWHDKLNGDDNQVTILPYAGIYAGTLVSTDAVIMYGFVVDSAAGVGSSVGLVYAPADADLSKVLVAGAPIVIGVHQTTIRAVRRGPANGAATVITVDHLPASQPVLQSALAFDFSALVGGVTLGAAELYRGGLVLALEVNNEVGLYSANIETGAPDLSTLLGAIHPAGMFGHPQDVGGVAALADGRMVVFNASAYPQLCVVSPTGVLQGNLAPGGTATSDYAVRLATGAASPVQEHVNGAAVLGDQVYVVSPTGVVHQFALSELANVRAGAFSSTIGTGAQDYVQAVRVGQIAKLRAVAGMWSGPEGLRILAQASNATWGVRDLALPAATLSGGYGGGAQVGQRAYRGACEINGVMYATAGDRIYKFVPRADSTVRVGRAAVGFDARLLASGVLLGKTRAGVLTATYAFEEIV